MEEPNEQAHPTWNTEYQNEQQLPANQSTKT